jgi:hypothetical protein
MACPSRSRSSSPRRSSLPGAPPAPGNGALVIIIGDNHSGSQDDKEEEQEMFDSTKTIETAAISGRAAVCRLVYDAVFKGTINPIHKFHLQLKENKETK